VRGQSVNFSRWGFVFAVALVGLGTVILFWPVFSEGKVVVPGDIPYSNPFWRTDPAGEYVPPQNSLLSDQIEQFYVWHRIAAKAMQQEGRVPLWNPYIFTGRPLVANAQSTLFYPPNLLLLWLTPGQIATLRAVFNLLVAGAFTFLFCRDLGISPKGSILSAVAFAFSGPVIVWLGHTPANVLVWLPLIMWAGEKLLNRNPPLPWIVALAFGVAMSVLGGHPETTFHVLAVFSIYFFARLWLLDLDLRKKAKLLAVVGMALILGLMISGLQLLPFVDFLLSSSTLAQGGRSVGGSNWFYSEEWLPNLATLVTIVYPNFFGNPTDNNYSWPFTNYQNYNEQTAYLGLIPLALAVGALFAFPKRRRVIVLAVLALFCIGVAWRLPGFELVNHLPLFSMVINKRLRMVFVFLVAVLAGFGFDGWRHAIASRRPGSEKILYASGSILLLPLLILLIIAFLKYASPLILEIEPWSFLHRLLFGFFSLRQPKTMIPAFVAFAAILGIILLLRRRSWRPAFEALLILLTLTELLVLAWGYNPVMKESDILPSTRAIELLKEDQEPFRIMTTDQIFWPNYPAVYEIADVAGYDLPIDRSYSDLFLAQGGKRDYRQEWDPSWPLLDLLNTKYVITHQELDERRFSPVYSAEAYRIYENQHALPRAFMAYDVTVLEDRAVMLERMLGEEWDPRRTVLLQEPLPPQEERSLGSQADSHIAFVSYKNDTVILDVQTEAPGLLVLSDLYTKDWLAHLDAEPVKLYRANYAYRAVFVPEGRHRVTFTYAPRAFTVGVGLTVLSLIVAIALLIAGMRARWGRGGNHDH
jgi:hypothetical protein